MSETNKLNLDPWGADLRGVRILITGSHGYIASRLIPAFAAHGAAITVFRRPDSTWHPANSVQTLTGDPSNPETWTQGLDHGIDVIIHLSAQTNVAQAEKNPAKDIQDNIRPFLALLTACRDHATVPTVILAGTATEVGLTPHHPVDETVREDPVTIYDLHKLMNERYLRHFVRQGWVKGATLRLANVYGPGPTSSTSNRGVLGLMARKAAQGENLTIYGEGESLRDYIYLDDVVRAFAAVATTQDALNEGTTFLVASGIGTSLKDAFQQIADEATAITGHRIRLEHVEPDPPLNPIDKRDFVADPRLLQTVTGWSPRVPLNEGLRRTVKSAIAATNARASS